MLPKNIPSVYTEAQAKTKRLRDAIWNSHPNTPASLREEFMAADAAEIAMETEVFNLGEFVVLTESVEDRRLGLLTSGVLLSISRDIFGRVAGFTNGKWSVMRGQKGQKVLFRKFEARCELVDFAKESREGQQEILRIRLALAGFLLDFDRAAEVLGTVLLGLVDAGRLDAKLLPELAEKYRTSPNTIALFLQTSH